jgi:predicted transcriptional regulator
LDAESSKCLQGFWAISDRVLLVKLQAKPFNIAIIQVYAPTSESSDNELEAFYCDLDKAKKECKSQEVVIMMGDLNAKVGSATRTNVVVGPHGLGDKKERGDKLIEWSTANGQIITNTWFENHRRRKHT